MEVRRLLLLLPSLLLSVAGGCAPLARTQETAPPQSVAGQGRSGAAERASEAATPAPSPAQLPGLGSTLAGRELVQQKFSSCHGLDVALSGQRSAAGWAEVIEAMVGHGLVVSAEESRVIQSYLAAHH
ncbi:MAG: hypothetical protein M3Q08_04710 [Pseudomonadota bacterium]|nr:hypothetical protein [Pseudomonadota bacterium]